MSFNTPSELQYAESHEWVRSEGDLVTIGITDYAQDALGDVVYIELPEVGATLTAGSIFGAVESVKAASDLYMPVGGTIEEVNDTLINNPELINSEPYGAGWMLKVRVSEPGKLLDAAGYEKVVAAVGH
jgi:glycine cleavage system H protein